MILDLLYCGGQEASHIDGSTNGIQAQENQVERL